MTSYAVIDTKLAMELRRLGLPWSEVAEQCRASAYLVRKALRRAGPVPRSSAANDSVPGETYEKAKGRGRNLERIIENYGLRAQKAGTVCQQPLNITGPENV